MGKLLDVPEMRRNITPWGSQTSLHIDWPGMSGSGAQTFPFYCFSDLQEMVCIETLGKQWTGPPNKDVMDGWKELTGILAATLTSKSWPFEGQEWGKEAKGNFYTSMEYEL